MRPIPKLAVDLVASLEGCRLEAYRDSVGVLTIGYGHTGLDVAADSRITRAEARRLLAADLEVASRRLYGVVKASIVEGDLTEGQYAALLSFVFNLGAGKNWTIWKRLNARAFDQVPIEMMKFVNAGGRKLKGLVNRRTAEVRVWSEDEPGSTNDDPPSSVTRAISTPPTAADPTPPHRSASLLAVGLSATAAAPVAATQVVDALEPFSPNSPLAQQLIATVSTLAAIAAFAGLILGWLAKRRARG